MGVLTHNRGSREVGGDFHPQTIAWASRMLAAGYVVDSYHKNIHTKFCNSLKAAGAIGSVIQFITPVWGSAGPNMVSVLTSAYQASVVDSIDHSASGIKPLNTTSWVRSGLDVGNWPAGLASNNSGQLYYTVGYTAAAQWDMGVRAPPGTAEGLTLGNYNGIVYAHSGFGSQVAYGAVATESEHLLSFNSSPAGQQLMKKLPGSAVTNIGSNLAAQEGQLLPNNVYPFCGLHTTGTGIQLNTLGRYHKAFMLYKDATHAQAAAICEAVYTFVNAIIPVVAALSYLSYNGVNMAYNGSDILFTN